MVSPAPGGYIAGYFDPTNELPASSTMYSNAAEIYYIDANPGNLNTASGIRSAMTTTAHEFQHMINWNYHRAIQQMTFVDESCSELAEVYCGYPSTDLSRYANETNRYLFDWRTNDNRLVLNDYARAQRFSLYLRNGNTVLSHSCPLHHLYNSRSGQLQTYRVRLQRQKSAGSRPYSQDHKLTCACNLKRSTSPLGMWTRTTVSKKMRRDTVENSD